MKSKNFFVNLRSMNFETLMWVFTRLSALAMYALILFGIFGALYMGARYQMNFADVMRWGFMPNSIHVQNTNIPDIAPWASLLWKLSGSALLLLATAHGVHGLVVVADDYIVTPRGRQVVRVLSIIMMLAMSGIGLYILWTS
jgi:succinate dehydrogenase hydrophobic anchor subunit